MKPAAIRRITLVLSIVIFIICFWLWKASAGPLKPEGLKLKYKVIAYTSSKKIAEKIRNSGFSEGFKGSISKGQRKINKFMGYIVVQDFAITKSSSNVSYINDFLKERGFKSQIIKNPDGKTLSIQVGGYITGEEKAKKIASEVYKEATVTFEVRKYFKEVSYTGFTVVFQDIDDKDTAKALKSKLEAISSDLEIISY